MSKKKDRKCAAPGCEQMLGDDLVLCARHVRLLKDLGEFMQKLGPDCQDDVEHLTTYHWSQGRELGHGEATALASKLLLEEAGRAFAAGQDERARILRDVAPTIVKALDARKPRL